MTEQQESGSPLIDPEKAAAVLKTTPVQSSSVSGPVIRGKKRKTADELGPKEYCWGTGRRKTSVARVRVRPGDGKIIVNKKELADFFPRIQDQLDVKMPLEITNSMGKYDVFIKVHGGGITGQAGACKLGISRALLVADPETFGSLRDAGLLTRDSRMKERKKYGRRKARRSFQFSKR